MEALALIIFILFVVAIVGHGIWSAVAWLFRGGHLSRNHLPYEPTLNDDRVAAARYFTHLRVKGIIDDGRHAELMGLVSREALHRSTFVEQPEHERHPKPKTSTPELEPLSEPLPPRESEDVVPPQRPARSLHEAAKPIVLPVRAYPPVEPPMPEPRAPATRRRAFSEVMAAFMAEKNIRWGELIGGLLILCCSTALVISLWSQIEAVPVLKFLIFTGTTAALFGAGLFIHHRWHLPTTGYAVLMVSTMLVPLNLLAFAAFTARAPAGGNASLIVELVAVGVFGWLTWLAGRIVMPNAPVSFACGVVGLSSCSLLTRLASPLTDSTLFFAAMVPIAAYAIVMGHALLRSRPRQDGAGADAKSILVNLGVQTVACCAPVGLLLYESGDTVRALHLLAPLMCLFAGPALFMGVLFWHRPGRSISAELRTAFGAVALLAAGLMVLGIGLAWPTPSRLLPTLVITALAMVAASRVTRSALSHAIAATCFAFTWLLIVQLTSGQLEWSTSDPHAIIAALISVTTGKSLVAVVIACAVIGFWFQRKRRRAVAIAYGAISTASALASIGLITALGFGLQGDTAHVTWVYLVYAAIAFTAARLLRSHLAVWAGGLLFQTALVNVVAYVWPVPLLPWPTALLIGAGMFAVAAVVLSALKSRFNAVHVCIEPLAGLAVAISVLAATWMTWVLSIELQAAFAVRMLCISALWLVIASLRRWPLLFAGSQLALAAGVCVGLQDSIASLPWYQSLTSPLQDPWVWQAHLAAIGAVGLTFAAIRAYVHRRGAQETADATAPRSAVSPIRTWHTAAKCLLDPQFPSADQVMSVLVMVGLGILSIWSVWPSVVAEHGWDYSLMYGMTQQVHASGIGSWILLAIVLATGGFHLSRRSRRIALQGVLLATWCGLALVAARFETAHQVVGAWRWLSAAMFLVLCVAVWTRGYWLVKWSPIQRLRSQEIDVLANDLHLSSFVLFALPVLLLTGTFTFAVGRGVAALSPIFSDFSLRISLLGPSLLVAACLFGHGVRERLPAYAAAAGILAGLIVTGTELCVLGHAGTPVSLAVVIRLVQLFAIASAATAIAWHEMHRGLSLEIRSTYPVWPLHIVRALLGVVLIFAIIAIGLAPQAVSATIAEIGTVQGVLALVLAEWALVLTSRPRHEAQIGWRTSLWVFLGAALLACTVARFDTGNWLCFHTLLLSFVIAASLRLYLGASRVRKLLGSGWQETFEAAAAQAAGQVKQIEHDLSCFGCAYNLRGLVPSGRCPECGVPIVNSMEVVINRLTPRWSGQLDQARTQTATAILACVLVAALFALRAALDDPQRPWWSAAAFLALSAQSLVVAGWVPRRMFAYLAGIEVCLAASIWWTTLHWGTGSGALASNLSNLTNANVIALGVVGTIWLFTERLVLRCRAVVESYQRWPAFHRAAATALTVFVSALAGFSLYAAVIHDPLIDVALMRWIGWGAATAFTIICMRYSSFHEGAVGLYVLGLAAIALIVAQTTPTSLMLTFEMSLALPAYVLITTLFWRFLTKAQPDSTGQRVETAWLFQANSVLAAVSIALGVYISCAHPHTLQRVLVGFAPVICAAAARLAARGHRQPLMQTATLALIASGAVLFAWSGFAPGSPIFVFHRAVAVFGTVSALNILLSGVVGRIDPASSWRVAIRRNVLGASALAGMALLYCCGCEISVLAQHETLRQSQWAAMVMAIAAAALIVFCVVAALRDRLDPCGLKAGAKGIYVYLAEFLAAVLALHIRVTMPWLFSGVILQYWPLLLMALAFAAVAAGEALDRRGLGVVARPLGRTGAFLPALALLEYFIASSQVHYSIVLLTSGSLYAVLAGLRKSVGIGVLAAMALTGSLWYLLQHTPGLGIAQHPQLWFIPPALAVLAAGHLNRSRLREDQRAALNYACLLAIYLSSTADIFLIGVSRAPWLPLVLAGLSVAGILVALASRIRSFLLLGTGFLCMSLLTMIWHAAADLGWTWVWYVSGILLGAGMITLFALFEKKRRGMIAWVEELRSWAG